VDEHVVYLALGSNVGNRVANLKAAIAALPPQMEVKAKSRVYETPPWGYANQEKFLNQALKVQTYVQPEPLLRHLKRLEVALGREVTFQNGPRVIDIDILFYDDLVFESPPLAIPHPHVHERGFVLMPLMDIAPDFVHPVKKQTIRQLITFCDVSGIVPFG
jgi:2-amino-4-hydroxy-6-hydroxymethyldihydropteridine diphosphokinase